jgi:hypothetical protein
MRTSLRHPTRKPACDHVPRKRHARRMRQAWDWGWRSQKHRASLGHDFEPFPPRANCCFDSWPVFRLLLLLHRTTSPSISVALPGRCIGATAHGKARSEHSAVSTQTLILPAKAPKLTARSCSAPACLPTSLNHPLRPVIPLAVHKTRETRALA